MGVVTASTEDTLHMEDFKEVLLAAMVQGALEEVLEVVMEVVMEVVLEVVMEAFMVEAVEAMDMANLLSKSALNILKEVGQLYLWV